MPPAFNSNRRELMLSASALLSAEGPALLSAEDPAPLPVNSHVATAPTTTARTMTRTVFIRPGLT